VSRRPDDDQLAEFLLGGPARDNQGFTFFRGVSSVLPGYFVIATPQEFAARRYWDFDATRRTRLGSFQEYAAGFRYHFEQAVRRRLRSAHAVALGVSGGLDSSSNFCVAQALMRRDSYQRSRLLGLSYTFAEGSPPDEQAYLLEIERAYGIAIQRIHTRPMGPLEGSGGEVWHVEAPLLDGEWHNTHMFHQTAHRLGARVLLTGQWGDNMLFDQAYLLDLFHRRAWGTIGTHLKEFRHWMTDVDPKHFRRRFLRDLVRSHVPTVLVPLLRKLHTQFLGRTRHLAWYNTARLKGQLASQQSVSKRTFNSAHARALYGEARSRYNVLSMEWNNKAASMHGLEIAFPFLDRDLVAFLMGIPGDMQTWKGVPKAILREAMRGVVPDAILDRRRKADFTDLINEGMERDYPQLVHCLLSEGMAVRLGYVRGDVLGQELGRLKDGLKSSDCRAAWSLSGLLGLELWLQVFFGENTNGKGGVYASAC